jgi:NAD(P)-dependent dehydrogenase (short-subunit alcohol dehydrogenase family)
MGDATPRRAVVIGGSRGIGRAIVDHLARSGHAVVATGRDVDALEALGDRPAAGSPYISAYAAAKHAAVGLVRAGTDPTAAVNGHTLVLDGGGHW